MMPLKKTILIFAACLFPALLAAQPEPYLRLANKANLLYNAKDYKNSAVTYSEAFKSIGWKGTQADRYNAACSWSMAKVPDSAFYQLNYIVDSMEFTEYDWMKADKDLAPLHSDKRWKPLLAFVKSRKEKREANYNKPLIKQLQAIYREDQQYRLQLDSLEKKYGWESSEVKSQWAIITKKDSVNQVAVKSIIDKYGWLGADVVGDEGNSTLFLVIQHADIATQMHYVPLMREAVKSGKADASSLALLEDRIALRSGKKQIYGSQVGTNKETGVLFVLPLEDPDNVDKRRAEVGLQPIAEYLSQWNLTWDAEQYKKDLENFKWQ